jgi:hypothetical protein
MPIHGSMFQEFQETTGQDPFTLQNKKLLKINMQLRAGERTHRFDGRLPRRRPVREHRVGWSQQDAQEGRHRRGCQRHAVHRHR